MTQKSWKILVKKSNENAMHCFVFEWLINMLDTTGSQYNIQVS